MPSDGRVSMPMSLCGWLGTLFLSALPGVNIILWFIWAFTAKKAARRNFSKAALILLLIFIVLAVAAIGLYGPQILEFVRSIDPDMFLPAVTEAPG